MAQAQLKFDHDLSDSDLAAPALPYAPGVVHAASPARALQDELLARTAATPRWPIGQRVALIAAASMGLWTVILHTTVQVGHAVA